MPPMRQWPSAIRAVNGPRFALVLLWTRLPCGVTAQFTLTLNTGSAVTIVNTAVVATSSFDVNAANNNHVRSSSLRRSFPLDRRRYRLLLQMPTR